VRRVFCFLFGHKYGTIRTILRVGPFPRWCIGYGCERCGKPATGTMAEKKEACWQDQLRIGRKITRDEFEQLWNQQVGPSA
jgi:hypothetical protein